LEVFKLIAKLVLNKNADAWGKLAEQICLKFKFRDLEGGVGSALYFSIHR